MAQHNDIGKEGELKAMEFLIDHGYEILETNYQIRKAEIDIIARKEDWLIVVEVKTRTSRDYGNPEDFIDKKKIKQLILAINEYVEQTGIDLDIRFDVMAVFKKNNLYEVEHFEDAFYHF